MEAEVQDIYLMKDPLTAARVLLCLKLIDFIVITYFSPSARKIISDTSLCSTIWEEVSS